MINKNFDIVIGKTHLPEYRIHKYWSRKPYNVINYFFKELIEEDDVVLDLFCGSGVALREASLLGAHVYGFDINPSAYLISKVTTDPPETNIFESELEPILDRFYDNVDKYYKYNNEDISYLVHEIIVKCSVCDLEVNTSMAEKKGRSYLCPHCNNKLNFNLKNLIDTKITLIKLSNAEITDKVYLDEQNHMLKSIDIESIKNYNKSFIENKRILTFEGMKTSDLFTTRNFLLLSHLADEIHAIEDEKVKNAALILLTGSIAQCSRLIAYRNNMKTGGPAWSVPGFWVPPIHLESNPAKHIKARYKKLIKGLQILNSKKGKNDVIVKMCDCRDGIDEIESKNIKADLIFLDPPYGDNIPYTEFSKMWNSFTNLEDNINKDISISDRIEKRKAWAKYQLDLLEIIGKFNNILSKKGKILVTFNNNDVKAWKALLKPLQENKFKCIYTTFQMPAVVSSKAQFSPKKSYISDLYSIFIYDEGLKIGKNINCLKDSLIRCASARYGKIPYNLAYRIISVECLKNNISYELLDDIEFIIEDLFYNENGILSLKNEFIIENDKIDDIVYKIVKKSIKIGISEFDKIYHQVVANTENIGSPDPIEYKQILNEIAVYNKDKIIQIKKDIELN